MIESIESFGSTAIASIGTELGVSNKDNFQWRRQVIEGNIPEPGHILTEEMTKLLAICFKILLSETLNI